jgi:hypothetical protein
VEIIEAAVLVRCCLFMPIILATQEAEIRTSQAEIRSLRFEDILGILFAKPYLEKTHHTHIEAAVLS